MPYKITWEPGGAHRKFWGLVTSEDIRRSFAELHEFPNYHQLRCILHDHSEMTARDWGEEDLVMLGANHLGASYSNDQLVDIVVTTDQEFIAFMRRSAVIKLLANSVQFFEALDDGRQRYDQLRLNRKVASAYWPHGTATDEQRTD